MLVKYNQSGNELWNWTWNHGETDFPAAIAIDSQDNIYMAGSTDDGGLVGYALFTIKFTQNFLLGTTATDPDIDGNFDLFWEAAPQADNYSVYRHDGPITQINGSLAQLAQGLTSTSFPVAGMANGTYYFVVEGRNATGSVLTNCVAVDVRCYPPWYLSLSSNADDPDQDGTFTLSWNQSIYAHNYSVYRSYAPISVIDASCVLVVSGNTNRTCMVKSVANGTCYYVVVAYNQFGSRLSNCLRIDVDRNLIWYSAYEGTACEGQDVAVDQSGYVHVTGFRGSMSSELLLLKLDSSGNVVWSRSYGAGYYAKGYGVAVDLSGNVYACGVYYGDLLLVKYDAGGTFQWARTRGGAPYEEAHRVAVDSNGDIVYVGDTGGFETEDAIVVKYDSAGNYLGSATWGGAARDFGWDVVIDGGNNIFISGMTNSTGAGKDDLFVVKFNSTLHQQWNSTWGYADKDGDCEFNSVGIDLDASGNVYIADCRITYFDYYTRDFNSTLVKFNSSGGQVWNVSWTYDVDPDDSEEQANDVVVTDTGTILVAGTTPGHDFYLARFNQNGVPQGTETWDSGDTEWANAMAFDGSGFAYLTGESWGVGGMPVVKFYLGPSLFNLTTDATSPETDGHFTLSWTASNFAQSYNLYRSADPITEINASVTLVASGLTGTSHLLQKHPGGQYYFAVAAVNEWCTKLSNSVWVNVSLQVPGAFVLSTNAHDPDLDGTFDLTWTASTESDNFTLYRHENPITEINGSLTAVESGLTNNSYHFAGLSDAFYFVVVSRNWVGDRSSNVVFVNSTRGPPGPFNILNSNPGFIMSSAFTLSWGASESADNYSVYYGSSAFTEITTQIEVDNGLAATSYPIRGLQTGYHYFVVVAANEYGTRLSNCLQMGVYSSVPVMPGFFDVLTDATYPDGDGTFNLTWSAASGVTTYSVYQSSSFFSTINANCTLIVSGNTNRTCHFIGYGTGRYYFRVVAFNTYGNRTSKCVEVYVAAGPPLPFTLSSDAGSPDIDGGFTLSWTAAGGAQNYSVYQHSAPITQINGSVSLVASGITGTARGISGLGNGTYFYLVVAYNAEGNSTSNCIAITVDRLRPVAFALGSDAGTPDGDGAFTLSWGASQYATNYSMYRHTSPIVEINGSVALLGSGMTSLSHAESGLLNGTYYYVAVAFNLNGNRTSSATIVTVSLLPPGSFTLSSTATVPDADGSFTLSWTASTGAQNYTVYSHTSPIVQVNGSLAVVVAGIVATSHPITGLGNGTYYYAAVSFNAYGNRTSNCIDVVVALLPPGPFTLASNAGTPDADGNVTLSWSASSGANTYSVYQHTAPITQINGSVTTLAQGLTSTSRLVSGLPNGTHYFIVVAFNPNGN
ncbi:MAG: hypothetical protein JW839_08615, partial [Candidatus Lokiarchaeota archaeon]|nr:hypothetical protein [Candidatus Lokiarchaeota archaeon]